MLLTYADESFSPRLFLIAAVVATPEQVKSLSEALDDHVASLSASHTALHYREELHGYEVFHGKKNWSTLAPRQRVRVFIDVFDLIAASGVRIVIRGLDVTAHRSRHASPRPPYSVGLTRIFEEIQLIAENENDLALLICDEYHKDDRHRKLLTDYRRWTTPSEKPVEIDRIIDTIHFTPSHESRLIQAADMVAFIRLRKVDIDSPDPRETRAIRQLWNTIDRCLVTDRVEIP
ncbi:MAG: DUF3800 domain-containing protein [Aeromicrobium sp.]|uniref:DUF3800 domain-containing protein n=1 Tax=Aeromicrobium sp. TaxID=1871063 RepID=UPI0039E2FE86